MDHPRIRGEHRAVQRPTRAPVGSSPHTRGAPQPAHTGDDHVRIIPAYAGSTGAGAAVLTARRDHPRIRGEHTAGARDDGPRGGIIPAYAGSTSRPRRNLQCKQDHPRIRGEHMPWGEGEKQHPGSSPHTRGARSISTSRRPETGIIPAYAGSTIPARPTRRRRRDHPRIRGEHIRAKAYDPNRSGSSPHTRGAPPTDDKNFPNLGIIPAYAGSTSGVKSSSSLSSDHPRIRGEHVGLGQWSRRETGSSPHTRGAPELEIAGHGPHRIIPAYAGSTRLFTEYERRGGGSSPHTRGARQPMADTPEEDGIIPAYAGSTPGMK